MNLTGGNLLKVRREWLEIGGSVVIKQGTGDEIFRHPMQVKPIRVNRRKKSAGRKLTTVLRQLKSKINN